MSDEQERRITMLLTLISLAYGPVCRARLTAPARTPAEAAGQLPLPAPRGGGPVRGDAPRPAERTWLGRRITTVRTTGDRL